MYRAYGLIVLILSATSTLAKFDESLLSEDVKSLLVTLHNTCVDQIGIDEARIDKLKEAVFEDDEKSKCYVKCIMSESGVMDENGEFDLGAMSELIPEKLRVKTKTTVEGCLKQSDAIKNHCEKAYEILQCNYKADPENYFFV